MSWKWRLSIHVNTAFLAAWCVTWIITPRLLYVVGVVVTYALLAHACWAAEQNEKPR